VGNKASRCFFQDSLKIIVSVRNKFLEKKKKNEKFEKTFLGGLLSERYIFERLTQKFHDSMLRIIMNSSNDH